MPVRRTAVVLCLGLAALSLPAAGRDGPIELNQQRAVDGGVTVGDAPDFPITLSAPGSYVLTGNLDVADINAGAIDVTADDVTIDLNGFLVKGPSTCTGSGSGISCGTQTGASGIASGSLGTVVKNGSVRGFGVHGVFLNSACRVEDVTSTQNRSYGIRTLFDCVVSGSIASRNGSNGIAVSNGSRVAQSTARGNGLIGIQASSGCSVQGSAVNDNANTGISLSTMSSAHDNASTENGSDGISALENTMVSGNALWSNTGFGLDLGNFSGYWLNVLLSNSLGTVDDGLSQGVNACNGNTTCP
jgi:hypothetical protein